MKLQGQGQKGQTIVIFALAAVALIGLASIAVDLGLAQADRRDIQAAADGAALAGTRQYSLGGDVHYVHFVAMRYLVASIGGSLSGLGCTQSSCGSGPSTTFTVGAYSFTLTDTGQILDISVSHTRQTLLAGAIGFTTVTVGTGARARPVGPVTIGAIYSVAALGSTGFFDVNGGGQCAPSGNVSGNVYSNTVFGATSGGGNACNTWVAHPVAVPDFVTGYDATGKVVTCPGNNATQVDFGPSGSSNHWFFVPNPASDPGTPTHTNVPVPLGFDGVPPRPPSIVYPDTAAGHAAAKDPNGNYKPGTYDGWVPNPPGMLGGGGAVSGGVTYSGGVFLIRKVDRLDISQVVQNNAHGGTGNAAGADAVAIVVDSSDTRDMTIGSVLLNGYEEPFSPTSSDSVGTHNFVLYGGPSNTNDPTHSGFQGSIASLGPGDSPNISGIMYMPNSTLASNGSSKYTFYGAVYMHDYTLGGGGNNSQGFRYICGLGTIQGTATDGGLTR